MCAVTSSDELWTDVVAVEVLGGVKCSLIERSVGYSNAAAISGCFLLNASTRFVVCICGVCDWTRRCEKICAGIHSFAVEKCDFVVFRSRCFVTKAVNLKSCIQR